VLLRDATHTNKFSTLLQSYVCLHVYLCLPECSPSPAFVCFLWRSHMVCARICIRNQHSMMNIAEIVCRCTHFDESRHTSVARESTIGGAAFYERADRLHFSQYQINFCSIFASALRIAIALFPWYVCKIQSAIRDNALNYLSTCSVFKHHNSVCDFDKYRHLRVLFFLPLNPFFHF
jgi:hypothetical protein